MKYFFKYYDDNVNLADTQWLKDKFTGPKNTLHTIVPQGFENYVRIFPPCRCYNTLQADDTAAQAALRAGWPELENSYPITWKEVALKNCRKPSRLMQWHDLYSLRPREKGNAGIEPPLDGELTPSLVKELLEIFSNYGGEHQEIICAFWEGYNNVVHLSANTKLEVFPGQNYHILKSTVAKARLGWLAAFEYAVQNHCVETMGYAPNAIWPTNQKWFLSIPYDRNTCYFGGSKKMAESIINHPSIESFQVFGGDDIWGDDISQLT